MKERTKEKHKMSLLGAGALKKKREALLACVYFWSSQSERLNYVIPLLCEK